MSVKAINSIYFAQLVNVVGSGAFAGNITAVVGGSTKSTWFTSAIAILTTVLSPPCSQAADYWGRKWILVILTACGCIGSIIISRADSVSQVIAGFVVSGLSFGAQPLLHAVTSEVLPRKYRSWAQASVNISAALGGATGLLVGGALTRNGQNENFRIYWYISAGVYAIAATLCAVLYNPPRRELQSALTTREKLRRLDWVGYGLLIPALTLFTLGLTWSQNPYPWNKTHVLAPFLVGVALAVALVMYELRGRRDGLFHHDLFHHRNYPIALFCVFCEGIAFFCANNYFAFEVNVLFSQDPLFVGLHYCISFFTYATFAAVAAIYVLKTRSVRLPVIVAFCFFVIFYVLMATVSITTSERNIWGYPVFLGAGLGICLTALITAAQFSTPPELIAITSGLMISVRSLGGSIGLAIYNAIFNAALNANMGSKISGATIPLGLPPTSVGQLIGALTAHNFTAAQEVPGVSPEIIHAGVEGMNKAFAIGFRNVWIAAGSFALCAAIGMPL
jgi:MFS family permease